MKVKQRNVLTPIFNVDANGVVKRASPAIALLIDACERDCADIRFDATALPVHAIEYVAGYDGLMLNVTVLVPGRDEDIALEITRSVIQPWHVIEANGTEYVVRWTLETICGLLAHEAQGNFRYDGKLVIDNHGALK